MRIADRVFVVTGGGNGIGREVAVQLVAKGARVAALDVSEAGLAETERLAGAGDRLSTHVVDLADRGAVEALAEEVLAAHGRVDGLLNVAGIIQPFIPLADLSYEQLEKVMAVNFWGVVHTVKTFLPLLRERPEAAIVNVSSMGALAPVPGQSGYGASKAAVTLLTQALQAELQKTAVTVTTVFPGAIGTDITKNSGVDMGRDRDESAAAKTTPADEAGRRIVEAVEKGTSRVRIGKDATMLDRLARLMPARVPGMIAKRMSHLIES